MATTPTAGTFDFGKASPKGPEANVVDTIRQTPVKEDTEQLDAPYYDERSVTISTVRNYSLFRKVNDKVMPQKTEMIGSSITSSRILCANKAEMDAYMPNILGISSNDPDFVRRVKMYFNNIQISVTNLGKKFDTGFHYYKKSDYYSFKKREEAINDEYDSVPRQNFSKLKEAMREKINKLNSLESEKYKYGYPNNVEEYLMYRHCLLYNDVAKDMAFINSDPQIRFYFRDDKKESERMSKHREQINKAKANYLTCLNDDELFNAVFIQYCVNTGLPVITTLNLDRVEKENRLDKFSTDEPRKFNQFFADKDVKLKGTIEILIARGELNRLPNNQNIVSSTGDFIGANIGEAVAWFKNPDNNNAVTVLYNKLRQM
jgi:hypothetical protein